MNENTESLSNVELEFATLEKKYRCNEGILNLIEENVNLDNPCRYNFSYCLEYLNSYDKKDIKEFTKKFMDNVTYKYAITYFWDYVLKNFKEICNDSNFSNNLNQKEIAEKKNIIKNKAEFLKKYYKYIIDREIKLKRTSCNIDFDRSIQSFCKDIDEELAKIS